MPGAAPGGRASACWVKLLPPGFFSKPPMPRILALRDRSWQRFVADRFGSANGQVNLTQTRPARLSHRRTDTVPVAWEIDSHAGLATTQKPCRETHAVTLRSCK